MLLQEGRWLMVGVGVGLLLVCEGCGGSVAREEAPSAAAPPDPGASAPPSPPPSTSPRAQGGDSPRCVETPEAFVACFGEPRAAFARTTPLRAVFPGPDCPDDASAFLDQAKADGFFDCYRPGALHTDAWCCVGALY